jgi:hypothetical protein
VRIQNWQDATMPNDLSQEALSYVGRTESEGVASATAAGIRDVQVVRPGQAVSADYRGSNRLRLYVVDGLVAKASFG